MDKEEEKKKKIAQAQSVFDSVDERMVVISSLTWLGLIALAIIVLSVLIWTFFGSITLNVEGRGISLTPGGVLNVPSKLDGRVVDIFVQKGEMINEGVPIASIYDYELEVALRTANEKMDSLQKDLENARRIALEEDKLRKEGIRENMAAVLFSINQRVEQLPFLKKDVEAKIRLYDEGLVSASQREQAKRNLMEENIRIEELEAKYTALEADLKKSYKPDELKSYERLYRDAANEYQRLQARNVMQQIKSPSNGIVLELQARVGEEVKKGQSIIWIEKPGQEAGDLRFFCFVPADQGHKVKKGMPVSLQLFNVDPQKKGYLMGTVADVSLYPVTDQYIYSIVQSQDLVEFLTNKQDALIEVSVSPIKDPESYSGFRWTSGKGPDIDIHSGLLTFVKIAIEKRKPISYVFPEWWLPEFTEKK